MPDSGAEAAGLREGDLIVGLDGEPIEDKGDKTIARLPDGDFQKTSRREGEAAHPARENHAGTGCDDQCLIRASTSVLKPHPDLERKLPGNDKSLLSDVLEKEGLTDEYVRLIREFRNETDQSGQPAVPPGRLQPLPAARSELCHVQPAAVTRGGAQNNGSSARGFRQDTS